MYPNSKKTDYKDKNFVRINHQIRVPKVRVIHGEQNLGVLSTDEAREIARRAELDLVEIAPQSKPPVCKIMDYGKYKYEQNKKDKKQTSFKSKIKEIRFGPAIGEGDLETKVNQANKFLEEGLKVQLTLVFKRRQNAHKDLGFEVMNSFITALNVKGLCSIEQQPRLEGKSIHCRLEPKRSKENE